MLPTVWPDSKLEFFLFLWNKLFSVFGPCTSARVQLGRIEQGCRDIPNPSTTLAYFISHSSSLVSVLILPFTLSYLHLILVELPVFLHSLLQSFIRSYLIWPDFAGVLFLTCQKRMCHIPQIHPRDLNRCGKRERERSRYRYTRGDISLVKCLIWPHFVTKKEGKDYDQDRKVGTTMWGTTLYSL